MTTASAPATPAASESGPNLLMAAAGLVLLIAPWLEPFAPGPSAVATTLMFAWLCTAIALGLGVARYPELIAWGWLAAALVSAAFGLLQYFGLTEIGAGIVNYTEPGTAFGNLRQRNQFASLMSIGTLAALYLAARGMLPRWAGAAMALLAVSSAASTSRTGLLQLVLIGLVSVAWKGADRARNARLCLSALAAYALAAMLLPVALRAFTEYDAPGLLDRVAAGPPCASRMVLWSNVLELIAERPWTGWGIGELDYAHYSHLYGGARFCDILDNAHNLPLHAAVELGVPVALLLVAGIAWWIWRKKPWRETDASRQLAWGVLLVIAVHSMLEYPLWYGPFQLATLLSVLLLRHPRAEPRPRLLLAGRVVAFVAVPLVLAYAAWDYHRVTQLYLAPEERAPAYREHTMTKASPSVIFARQVSFAALSITPLTRTNAAQMHELALDMLHFSPEPKVIEAVIDSAMLLHDEPSALWHMQRFRAAFPKEYESWLEGASLRRKSE